MAAKRIVFLSILVALSALTGCRSYCERHYPCPPPPVAYGAPQCCVPCCPQGAGYGPPAPLPPAQVNYQSSGCACVPNPNYAGR